MEERPKDHHDGDSEGPPEAPRWTQRPWFWFMVLLLLVMTVMNYIGSDIERSSSEGNFTLLVEQIRNGNVEQIKELESSYFLAKLRQEIQIPVQGDFDGEELISASSIRVVIKGDALLEKISNACDEKNTPLELRSTASEFWAVIFGSLLPILILVLFFWFISIRVRRQMGPGIFGKFSGNRAKRFDADGDLVTFEEVAGLRNVKKELQEIVDFLRTPEKYTRLGAKIPKGVLLIGPPGTGKTLLARAVAGEAGVPFFSISGSEFIELFVGVGASRVRELFEEAKKNAPCIIFIDEIDAVGRSRGAGLGGGHDEREQTLNQILSEMDGFETHQAVIVLAATNRPDVLDAALVRPGRFDRQVVVERPQKEGRRAILKVHTRQIPLHDDVDLEAVARGTIGFSGADLENLANEAALNAARENKNIITKEDFDTAKDKILLGTLRDETLSEKERKLTAFHEAGHALLAMLLPGADPVHSVTIVPRGRALGVTQQLPAEEIHSYSRTYLMNRIVILLGGRAAEEIVFNESTTGAENDLEQATKLIERMICRWGMSEKVGPISYRRGEEQVFLGREIGEGRHLSEQTSNLIDEEIRAFMEKGHQEALKLLRGERERLDKLANELLEKEVLTDREIYQLLEIELPPSLAEEEGEGSPSTEGGKSTESSAEKEVDPSAADEGLDPGMLGLEGA